MILIKDSLLEIYLGKKILTISFLLRIPIPYETLTLLCIFRYEPFIHRNKYRQRNVFLYPPAETSTCDENDPNVVGTGTCGVNGNSKIYEADQAASTCTENGEIEGPYAGVFTTKTELVGADNALVYQVILPAGDNGYFTTTEDRVYQSQL